MPSVETQTTWSWLKDLSVLSQLSSAREELELSLGKQEIIELTRSLEEAGDSQLQECGSSHDTSDQLGKDMLGLSFGFVPLAGRNAEQDTCPPQPQEDDPPQPQEDDPPQSQEDNPPQSQDLPQETISDTIAECTEVSNESSEKEPLLPPIVSAQPSTGEECVSEPDTLTLPPILKQLERLDCSSQSDLIDQDDSTHEADSDEDYSALSQALPNLPWPTILQYLRESESYAAKYFSLHNKQSLERRLRASKSTVTAGSSVRDGHKTAVSTGRKDGEVHMSSGDSSSEESGSDTNTEDNDSREIEETDVCDFCGEQKPKYSLLTAKHKEREDLVVCCDEYGEFCILVAMCLRQIVDKLQHGPPKKISVKLTKKQIKKTAEQRAFAMMCRKRKWEQLVKRNENAPTKKMMKQTRTIQFSLLSTSILDAGWMVRPQSILKHSTPRHKRAQVRSNKRRRMKQMNVLSTGVLKRLHNDMPPEGVLDQRVYSDGSPFVTILPNRTGQCYYRSGNLAISVFAPYSGVLAYLLYEDSTKALLGYLDELGRVSCYYPEGGLQLYSSQSGGVILDQRGVIKRRWVWEGAEGSTFQPTTLTLSKQLTVRCQSRGTTVMTFTSEHKAVKFTVSNRLHGDEALERLADSTHVDRLGDQLQQSKKQIGALLQCFQNSNRSRKLAQLRSVYDPGNREAPHTGTRLRTRSTGAIPLHTKTLKHTH